ncbi:S41 family peptidase [Longitalea arenae]|uniref:S41 family peptidase n=1 Tax=Longitalea arenae TaxID=2812558 RepID=UPI0019681739|nr:S41 family peptidase [Longitalea arenae]
MKTIVAGAVILIGLSMVSCKKDHDVVSSVVKNDTAANYARDIYLWYNRIPPGFDAHGFSDPNAVMEGIRAFSEEPGFNMPVDRWSFAMLKADWQKLSSGIGGDFGMNVFFFTDNDLRVSYVERESPAGKAGIKRSWSVKQINDNPNINAANAGNIIRTVYQSSTGTFVFGRPGSADTTITLKAASYREHPLLFDSVYTAGGRTTGYFVFNSFLGDTNEIKDEFARIFDKFGQAHVRDVVVDLRYNGGGYVSVQNLLANYLVPVAGNNDVMLTEEFNDKYSSFNVTQKFTKKGNLDLNRLFFIVSQNTASASELLINSLVPYMEVHLVGPSHTHGKPVGFYPIGVYDWYIFPVSFRTVNKNGQGSYFNGLALDHQVSDGLNKDWGDGGEACLSAALNYISSGSYARSGVRMEQRSSLNETVLSSNARLGESKFKGMIP